MACPGVKCHKVQAPGNGTVDPAETEEVKFSGTASMPETTRTFSCNPGFVPIHHAVPAERALRSEPPREIVLNCTSNGSWSEQPPACHDMCSSEPCRAGQGNSAGIAQGTCRQRKELSDGGGSFPYKYTCDCAPGWRLKEVRGQVGSNWVDQGPTCIDVDECSTGNGGCTDSDCKNTPGSFYCAKCTAPADCCAGKGKESSKATADGFPLQGADIDICCGSSKATCAANLCQRAGSDLGPWVQPYCIGPPDATKSILALGDTFPPAENWERSSFSASERNRTKREAGAHTLITVDSRDSRRHKNAELLNVCDADRFRATGYDSGGDSQAITFNFDQNKRIANYAKRFC